MPDSEHAPEGRSPASGQMRRTVVAMAVVTAFVAVALLLWNAADIFLLAFAGVLLASFINAPARWLSMRSRVPHGVAIGLVVLVLVLLGVGFVLFAGPRVADEATQLVERLPDSLSELRDRASDLPGGEWVLERVDSGGALSGGSGAGSGVVSRVTGTASLFWDGLAKLVFVVFVGLYLSISPRRYRDGAATLVPPAHRERAIEVMNHVGKVLQGWLVGQLIAMVIVGLLTWAGLAILGIPLALVLGLIAGLFEFVPIVGPVLAFVPAILLALTQDGQTVLWVALLYLIIQQLEGNVIVPLVQRRTVSLPPALTIGAVFVAGAAFGPVGLLVGTPLAAVALVLFSMLYRHDLLGEHVELPGGGDE